MNPRSPKMAAPPTAATIVEGATPFPWALTSGMLASYHRAREAESALREPMDRRRAHDGEVRRDPHDREPGDRGADRDRPPRAQGGRGARDRRGPQGPDALAARPRPREGEAPPRGRSE